MSDSPSLKTSHFLLLHANCLKLSAHKATLSRCLHLAQTQVSQESNKKQLVENLFEVAPFFAIKSNLWGLILRLPLFLQSKTTCWESFWVCPLLYTKDQSHNQPPLHTETRFWSRGPWMNGAKSMQKQIISTSDKSVPLSGGQHCTTCALSHLFRSRPLRQQLFSTATTREIWKICQKGILHNSFVARIPYLFVVIKCDTADFVWRGPP